MIFFIVVLLIAMLLGFYTLKEDKKFNNLLESVVAFDTDNHKLSTSLLNKSVLNKNNDNNDHLNDEEKKLLHISKLI